MKLYTIFVLRGSYRSEERIPYNAWRGGDLAVQWLRRIRAEGPRDAVQRCLPELSKELAKLDGELVQVFVGEGRWLLQQGLIGGASRLQPIQVVIESGMVRDQ